MKACSKCGVLLLKTEFKKASHHFDGLTSSCRACINKQQAAYRSANREIVRKRVSNWYKNNPEKAVAKARLYAKRHPAKVNARTMRRFAAQLQRTPKWLTNTHHDQTGAFYAVATKLTKEFGIPMQVDHIVPLQGKNVSGLHVPWNLQVISAQDNARKNNKY